MTRALVALSLALLAVRILSAAVVVVQPGFTDAYYYVDVARRLAHGQGLTADFVWNFLEAPRFAELPVASHRFWMPLASVVQAGGIAIAEPLLGTFRAAQAAIIAVAAFVPPLAYAAARSIGASPRFALVAAALTGVGAGAFAPAWVTVDSFAIAAVLGTGFFIAIGRAAGGSVAAGVLAGLCVGLLFLARAEGALFGLALLALAGRRTSLRAGVVGAAVAMAIGVAWLARGALLGGSPDLLARTIFLARYEDFFAINPSGSADLGTIVGQRVGALYTDLVILLLSLFLLLAYPLVLGARAAWRLASVRTFVGLALLLYVVEALVWPLHATRGSYFHSLAAFYPFAMALVAFGGERWLATRAAGVAALATAATLGAAMAFGAFGLVLWDATYNGGYRARVAALDAIPPGPFLAVDGAAWRWIADRPVFVTPADGPDWAACAAAKYGATSVVLESVHFSAYAHVYDGERLSFAGAPVERGTIRIYPITGTLRCVVGTDRAAADTVRGRALP